MPPKRKGRRAVPKGTKTVSTKERSGDEQRAGFLDLPAELRNVIYQLALVRPTPINVPDQKEKLETAPRSSQSAVPVVLHEPALLATCRQVRSEASPVFYGCNTFAALFALYGVKLMRQLGPERIAMLKALQACGTEAAKYITGDRWKHAIVKHVNNLANAASGSLSSGAVLVPKDRYEIDGYEKVALSSDFKVVSGDGAGEWSVEWVGRELDVDMYDYPW